MPNQSNGDMKKASGGDIRNTTGRGLSEISNIFLSSSESNNVKKPVRGLSAVTIRDATCKTCINMIEGSSREPKCRIFTFENKKYGVPLLETIDPAYACYCEHYEPERREKPVEVTEVQPAFSPQTEDECEIEEIVNVQKKVTYPDGPTSQQNLQKSLFRYLEAGYTIDSIVLRKIDETAKPKGKELREENVTISVKNNREG